MIRLPILRWTESAGRPCQSGGNCDAPAGPDFRRSSGHAPRRGPSGGAGIAILAIWTWSWLPVRPRRQTSSGKALRRLLDAHSEITTIAARTICTRSGPMCRVNEVRIPCDSRSSDVTTFPRQCGSTAPERGPDQYQEMVRPAADLCRRRSPDRPPPHVSDVSIRPSDLVRYRSPGFPEAALSRPFAPKAA